MDIAQLPHLPEKASESSETSDSESDSKDTSGITGTTPPCSIAKAHWSKHEGWVPAGGTQLQP